MNDFPRPALVPKYIEDVEDQPIADDAALSNEALEAGGIVPITAFVRTRSSSNAIRQRRKKMEAAKPKPDGKAPRAQLNIVAPTDEGARDILKKAAAALVDGTLTGDALRVALVPVPQDAEDRRIGGQVRAILDRGGWQAMILRHLIGA